MIGTMEANKENGKRKNVTHYYCDFCGYSNASKKSGLVETGHIRYDAEYMQYGKEAVCGRCRELMWQL